MLYFSVHYKDNAAHHFLDLSLLTNIQTQKLSEPYLIYEGHSGSLTTIQESHINDVKLFNPVNMVELTSNSVMARLKF